MLDSPLNIMGDRVDCIRRFATDVTDAQVKVERAKTNSKIDDAEQVNATIVQCFYCTSLYTLLIS